MHLKITTILKTLEQRSDLQPLFPKLAWNTDVESKIEGLKHRGNSTEMITLIAALHLKNDSLDRSHSYAQQIEHDPTGAYWHGIMHRMEEDYWNAKYWFRQAGSHPVMRQVQQRVAEWLSQKWLDDDCTDRAEDTGVRSSNQRSSEVLRAFKQGSWNSEQFCDLIHMSSQLDANTINILIRIQAIEIETLFQHTLTAVIEQQ